MGSENLGVQWLMGRQASTLANIATALNAGALPTLPPGFSHEFVPDASGGKLTGNIVQIPITKRDSGFFSGILTDPAFHAFAALIPAVVGAPFTGGKSLLAALPTLKAASVERPTFQPQVVGRSPMAFSDGDSGFFGSGGFFGGLGEALQGPLGQGLLGVGLNVLESQFARRPTISEVGGMAGPIVRSVGPVARTGAVVGRGFFNRFPNLAAAIQQLRDRGSNVSRGQLWSLMKRFGPELLISGGILTAAAVSELMLSGPGRRRMNPGNVKALRRAHRRMKSFHNVCVTNDRMLGGRRSTKRKGSFGGATSVVNVK